MATLKRYNGSTAEQVGAVGNDAYLTTFGRVGDLIVTVGAGLWVPPVDITILGLSAAVGTAPTGSAINLALETTAGTDYATTSIAAGTTYIGEGSETINTSAVVAETALRINITQVGSTTPGSDLSVFVRYRKT